MKRKSGTISGSAGFSRGLSPQGALKGTVFMGTVPKGDCPRSDSIFIEGLKCWAYVGVPEEERRHRQRLVIDITLTASLKKAGKSDDFRDAVDYYAVSMMAKKIAEGKKFNLVEAVAEQIAAALLKSFKVSSVEIRIRKFSVPQAQSVGVYMKRHAFNA